MYLMVISGGQTGADWGGLTGARAAGVETGGTAPPNWDTEDGPQQELLSGFGLISGPSDPRVYPKRTQLNVVHAHATVLFGNQNGRGTRLTRRYCNQYGKPFIVNPTMERLADFLCGLKVQVVNVTGNRESKNPGIQATTHDIIYRALRVLVETQVIEAPMCVTCGHRLPEEDVAETMDGRFMDMECYDEFFESPLGEAERAAKREMK